VLAGLELSDRTVWFLTGGTGFGKQYMWACCSRDGALSDLTRLANQKAGTYFVHFGLDTAGRLWLAWLDVGASTGRPVKLVELDPATLAPRTAAALTVPGIRTATAYDLTCAAVCRVVASRVEGDIVSWAPGERSPTRAVPGTRTRPANLLGASYRSGGLTVGYAVSLPWNPRKGGLIAIRVARGDGRGAHARRVGAADIPSTLNPRDPDHFALNQANYGTFTPDGLVFFATYFGQGTRVLAGLVPVAR
jgi:hypothetical protein